MEKHERDPGSELDPETIRATSGPDPEISDSLSGVPSGATLAHEAKGPLQLPRLVLAAAGLGVFDACLVTMYLGLWATNPETLLSMVRNLAGVSLILGLTTVVVGALVLRKSKRTGTPMPGTVWANFAVLMGLSLCVLTLLIPLVAVVRELSGLAASSP